MERMEYLIKLLTARNWRVVFESNEDILRIKLEDRRKLSHLALIDVIEPNTVENALQTLLDRNT